MKDHDSPEEIPTSLTPNALPEPQKRDVAAAVKALLQHGTIENATDRRLIAEATAFIETPTENLSDIMRYTSNIGEVLSGYMMQGAEAPPEVDALHGHLHALLCQYHIRSVRTELKQAAPDFPRIQDSMRLALGFAKILSKGYRDDSLLQEVQELQRNIDLL